MLAPIAVLATLALAAKVVAFLLQPEPNTARFTRRGTNSSSISSLYDFIIV